MIRINNLKVSTCNYEFRCTVSPLDLTEAQCLELNLDVGDYMDMQRELEAGGDYVVSWDYDIPVVYVENFAIVVNGNYIELDESQVNFSKLAEVIEKHDDGTWAIDKADAAADYFFDKEYDR